MEDNTMSNNNQGKLSKSDMEKLKEKDNQPQEKPKKEKEKLSTGTIIFRVACAVIAVVYFALLLFGHFFLSKDNVFLSSLDPFSGVENPNNLVRIISLCIMTLSISFVLRFFIGKLVNNKNVTKKVGVALIELLGNLVKYVSYIVLLILVLSALGVNTTELVAGLGILGLILGLGVTSLIEDIVAGVFIIAERLFDVGDIIVLDGFRGTVVSIGIRSTKIADVGNDVLTVRNSSIGSLVNLTDRVSSAAITIPIAPEEPIERVEEVMKNAHVETLAEKYPKMKYGPLALGVCGMTSRGVQNYLVVAGCKEEDKYEIERALFYEFKNICDKNNIKLGYTGPDDGEEE
jgi:small conductance mechanosensitive channel